VAAGETDASGDATLVVEVGDRRSTALDGQRHFAVSITPIRDRVGERVGSAVILFDVTRRVQLYKEVKQLAVTDELTGLFARRHFRELAKKELARAAQLELPVSLLIFDIDGFKAVNDSFGHHVGDEVLHSVAITCREQLRSIDLFSRYGGDEFCALLPQLQVSQALNVAERLRAAVAAQQQGHESSAFRVTISVGVAGVAVTTSQTLGELIKAADKALYRAKREGKDRVMESCAASESTGHQSD
jgi:diguanylate cyclase (GGDEF)-like protein